MADITFNENETLTIDETKDLQNSGSTTGSGDTDDNDVSLDETALPDPFETLLFSNTTGFGLSPDFLRSNGFAASSDAFEGRVDQVAVNPIPCCFLAW